VKSLLTYFLMVGGPIAGVLGVLHAGRGLRAPHAIGGEWRITAGELAGTSFVVEQSGEYLSIEVPVESVRLRGKLRGDTLELDGPGPQSCPTSLRAVLDASARPRRMSGALAGEGCATRALDATHAPRTAKGAAH
jgi:hypothetical protein